MRVLLIGGSGFIGRFVSRQLAGSGDDVAVLHRGNRRSESPVTDIVSDRNDLPAAMEAIDRFAPDVVIDLILSSGCQAKTTVDALSGHTGRLIALSSADVYRACAVLHRLDDGPLQAVPLSESSEVRHSSDVYAPDALCRVQQAYPWVDAEYDKVAVEREVLDNPRLPATVLRLPMIYGPGDPLHRFRSLLHRMKDNPAKLVLEEGLARWRAPRGYVENVAAAIVLAARTSSAAGRIYNVAEPDCCSELEWTLQIAGVVGWTGRIVTVRFDEAPDDARIPGNLDQHWTVDSTRIRRELGYEEPIGRKEALQRTTAWELSASAIQTGG